MPQHALTPLFAPQRIAVFGASQKPDSVGARVYQNLRAGGFTGAIYPLNPKYEALDDQPCYPDLTALPEPVDLAVVATPAATVPGIIRQCAEHKVPAAIVLSAGFGEAGEAGMDLERTLVDEARRGRVRLLGPNCLGLMRPCHGLNATFSNNAALPGSLALVSQSGALCTAILDWAQAGEVGFSAMVSLGDAAETDFGEILDFLAMDAETRSILLYVEGVRDARRFLSGLRAAARLKPVVVIKAGRHAEGSKAAKSHTGALVGADDVFESALRRAGVVRAFTISQLFAAARLLVTQRRLRGDRLAIVTNAGGPGVMATDHAAALDIPLAQLSPDTLKRLDELLPACWSHGNPVDILGDATPERYGAAVAAVLEDPQVDGVLAMLTPQAMTDPTGSAEAVIEVAQNASKPVLTCWMGQTHVQEARDRLTTARIPTFTNPESSLEAFSFLAHYERNQQMLHHTPGPLSSYCEPDIEGARLVVESALAERREWLSPLETRALLTAFHIPTLPALEARTPNEALVAAQVLGFPVALKILSPDILHKSDADGVRLSIANAGAVRGAYQELLEAVKAKRPHARLDGVVVEKMHRSPHGRELLVGVAQDPVFGPFITFGAGGVAVELLRDRGVELPPLNERLAESLIARTRVARLLESWRNQPAVHRGAIIEVLLRVSELVCALPEVRELDINPLTADEHGVMALDARVAVTYRPPRLLQYGHMAIHPYPAGLIRRDQLADGTDITIRPIRPEDADLTREFVSRLSNESRYFRFMDHVTELNSEALVRFTQIDYGRELALLAVTTQYHQEMELGVARYATQPDGISAEFSLVVDDAWQQRGIGSRLLTALMAAARDQGLQLLTGEILANNRKMLELVRRLGFTCRTHPADPGIIHAEIEL